MKESYVEGIATHDGPESYGVARKGGVEALTGVRAGRVLSREMNFLRDADAVGESGRLHLAHRYREMWQGPARSETPSTYADDERTREVGQANRTCEVSEQRWATGRGGDGGKGPGQGEPATAKRVPDTEPERRAQRAGAGTSSSNERWEDAVHRTPAPHL